MDDEEPIVLEFARVISVAASSTTRATTVQIAACGAEGADDSAERGDDVEVLQPAGLMAAPAISATTEAPFVRLGDRHVALGLIDKGASAQAVEGGETRIYGVGGGNHNARVRVRASGSIEVDPQGSGEVVLASGTLAVARATDPVGIDATLALWIAQVTAAVNALAPGSVTAVPGATVGTIASGAARVKA